MRKIGYIKKATGISGKIFLLFFFLTGLIRGAWGQDYRLAPRDTSDVRFINSRKFFIYKVEKGETLFYLSQKFKIPQEEIREFNPELNRAGLKAKMKLWIPAYSWLHTSHEVNDSVPSVQAPEKYKTGHSRFRVAILCNFSLPSVFIPSLGDTDSTYIQEPMDPGLISNLEFYEGCQHAAELLRASGIKPSLYVFDTQGDSARTGKFLKNQEMEDLDAIITNEEGGVLRKLNRFSRQHQIKLLSAGINSTDLIADNPSGISLLPSSLLQCSEMGRRMSEMNPGAHCILVKTSVWKETERLNAFRDGWKKQQEGTISVVEYSKSGVQGIQNAFGKGVRNIIFIPTSNEDLVTQMLNGLRDAVSSVDFSVAGLPTWLSFETLDPNLMEFSHCYLFSSGYINKDDLHVNSFRRFFRDRYNTEPGESAYQGYDAMNFLGGKFRNYIPGSKDNSSVIYKGLYSDYHFVKTTQGECLENDFIYLIRFSDFLPQLVNSGGQ
ncbi:MAG: LysM peptidoglycan-binding domain-containing protein [Bacteroidia bacterium]|nr:LysM peptidoglycan-binding domain-containing protein [Bacteroidia bacterium]